MSSSYQAGSHTRYDIDLPDGLSGNALSKLKILHDRAIQAMDTGGKDAVLYVLHRGLIWAHRINHHLFTDRGPLGRIVGDGAAFGGGIIVEYSALAVLQAAKVVLDLAHRKSQERLAVIREAIANDPVLGEEEG